MDKREERIATRINEVISDMMDKVLYNVLTKDPFVKEDHHSKKPLYAALVPDEIFKSSHFERRFVTPFGKVWEKLSSVVALEAHKDCKIGHKVQGNICKERLRRIQEVLNKLEHKKNKEEKVYTNWKEEIQYILDGKGTDFIPVEVVCDIFIESKTDNKCYAFELKAPLPNSDQTKVSKEKLFKLLAMEPRIVDNAYFALPYNPYGKKEDYAWEFPKRWFNMKEDESVLIGNEYWDLIGGEGTYDNFIKEINLLGKDYRERIYREFLEMDPPLSFEDEILK